MLGRLLDPSQLRNFAVVGWALTKRVEDIRCLTFRHIMDLLWASETTTVMHAFSLCPMRLPYPALTQTSSQYRMV